MSIKSILVAAKQIISDPKKWTQNDLAKNAEGHGVTPDDHGAVCFCSMGAIEKAAKVDYFNPDTFAVAEDAIRHLMPFMDNSIADFNDHESHADVLQAFDNAILTAPD